MSKRTKHIILAVALVQIVAILFLLIAPPLVQALPGEMRVRLARIPLGETLLEIGVTPMPTALAAPANVVARAAVVIPTASLTINLNFYGNPTTQAEAAAFLKPNREDRNVSPWQMVDYVNEQTNLRAFVGSGGDLDLIKRLLANDLPVVIEKRYELPTEGWLGHYFRWTKH